MSGSLADSRSPESRLPQGFLGLIAAQFCSALADNALLIVAIALLLQQGQPAWWAPLLKFSFTLFYVLLAPVLGPLADAVPKARLMAWMNGVKMLGVSLLLGGLHPVLGYAVVGLGAAAYAPAKYGLVTEMVPGPRLVVANSWIEVSVVGAALLGTLLGGALVSPWFAAAVAQGEAAPALQAALVGLLGLYGLAAALQRRVPETGARYPACALHPLALWREFLQMNRLLWSDREGGLSLAVTTLFWGVGATLQLAVLRWAADALGLSLEKAAYLQAAVAVGVVVGATLAGRLVPLSQARRVLPAGVLLGVLIVAAALSTRLPLALLLLGLTGAVGGVLVVPMNALLQHRGHALLTAGRSIAVQGFNENLSILVMLAGYATVLAVGAPIVPVLAGFGAAIALAMAALIVREGLRRVGRGG